MDGRAAQEQAEIGHILLVVLGGIGGDEPVMARLADDEPADQRAEQADGPAGQRTGFQSQAHVRTTEGADGAFQVLRGGAKAGPTQPLAIVVHAPEDAVAAVQIQRGIDRVRVHGFDFSTAAGYAPQPVSPQRLTTTQRTAPGVTACAPTRRPAPAAFPHRLRRPPQSLSLGSLIWLSV